LRHVFLVYSNSLICTKTIDSSDQLNNKREYVEQDVRPPDAPVAGHDASPNYLLLSTRSFRRLSTALSQEKKSLQQARAQLALTGRRLRTSCTPPAQLAHGLDGARGVQLMAAWVEPARTHLALRLPSSPWVGRNSLARSLRHLGWNSPTQSL
jgi:hypothetical protein